MRAAVYRTPGVLSMEDVPLPQLAAGEILVRVDCCGVCGSDVKKIQKGTLAGPRIFGHEIAGTVASVASGVKQVCPGQRVVVHHHVPCESCFYCSRRLYAQCERYKMNGTTAGFEPSGGGFAEYVKAMDWIVQRGTIPVPDHVSAEEASFIEPVNTCLKAVQRARLATGQTVLVVGQGPIGLLLLQLSQRVGVEAFSSDTLSDRLARSRRLGALAAIDATGDVRAEVRQLTGGRGVDVAFLAALGPAAFRQAVDATRPGGRIIVFAATSPGELAEVDLGALCLAEKEILTSYSASIDVQDLAAQLVFGREIKVGELVTHRLPLEEAARAVDLASRPAPGVLKIVLRVHEDLPRGEPS